MMGWYQNGWGTSGAVGMLMMLLVWGSLIALAVWVVTRATRTGQVEGPVQQTPRSILDRRFASGEIDADTYAQARRILNGQEGTPIA